MVNSVEENVYFEEKYYKPKTDNFCTTPVHVTLRRIHVIVRKDKSCCMSVKSRKLPVGKKTGSAACCKLPSIDRKLLC